MYLTFLDLSNSSVSELTVWNEFFVTEKVISSSLSTTNTACRKPVPVCCLRCLPVPAETTTTYIASLATSGFTLEELDAFGTLDALPASLDDRIWVGGKLLLGGISTTKIVTFTGTNSTASLIVGDMEEGYNSVMTLVRSQIDNGSCNISVASRRLLDGTITYSTPIATSSENRAAVISPGGQREGPQRHVTSSRQRANRDVGCQ